MIKLDATDTTPPTDGSGPSQSDPTKTNLNLSYIAFGSLIFGTITFLLGKLGLVIPLGGVAQDLIAASALACATLLALIAVALGSAKGDKKFFAYKTSAAIALASPVIATGAIPLFVPTMPFLDFVAIVGAFAVFTGVFLAALLKSSVAGHRRDAIELGLILIGIIAAAMTAVGIIAPSLLGLAQ